MQFNSLDLTGSDYNLKVLYQPTSLSYMPPLQTNVQPIGNKGYSFDTRLQPKIITLGVIVEGTSKANLQTRLDNLSRVLDPTQGVKSLILDYPDDRYYQAKLSDKIDWTLHSDTIVTGTLVFIAPDPLAYDNSAVSSDHNIDADPDTVTETPGGTGWVSPVYTFTAGEALTTISFTLENVTTGEELIWVGTLANTDELEIDVENFTVKKEGSLSMTGVSGQFPRLQGGVANSIKVTNASNTGALNIAYRNRYL